MRVIYIILGLLFIVSCKQGTSVKNNKKENVINSPYYIDIEKGLRYIKSIPLSNIGRDLEYIPLETNSKSLTGRINHIAFSKDYIFICGSSRKMLQFDRQGKFIRQIGDSGRGPGEYNSINSFCIDEIRKRVFVMGWWPHNFLEFDYDGKFIRSVSNKIPFESAQFMIYDTTGFVFNIADDSGFTPDSEYNLYITDFDCNISHKIKRNFIRKRNLLVSKTPLYYFNEILHFKQYSVDTLYTLKNEVLAPYAIFSLGKGKMDPDLYVKRSNREDIEKQVENKYEIKEVLENGECLFIKLDFGFSTSTKTCIYNKLSSETTTIENGGFVNDIDGGISFWPSFLYSEDSILVDYRDSYELIDFFRNMDRKEEKKKYGEQFENLEKVIEGINEMSNPVLIVLKTKHGL